MCILQPSIGLQPPRVRGYLITYSDAPQSIGLLWTSDQSVAETSTWQHTIFTTDNIHAPGGIRTHDRSRRAAVDLRLRPRGCWDRPLCHILHCKLKVSVAVFFTFTRNFKFISCSVFIKNVRVKLKKIYKEYITRHYVNWRTSVWQATRKEFIGNNYVFPLEIDDKRRSCERSPVTS